jgi:lipopolysaccharide transport system permease protein
VPTTPDVPRSGGTATAAMRPSADRWLGLVWTLVRTDFKTRYHGTIGGFFWALLKPAAMFAVLLSVFSFVFTNTRVYALDLVVGLFLWDFFAESTKVGLGSLHSKGYLLTKARFPAWVLVVSSISNALITSLVFAVVTLTYLTVSRGHPPAIGALLCFAGYLAAMVLIVIGFALAASVLFLRYRDLNQVWDVMLQVGFFIAPIVYPLGVIPERLHIYLYLWPPTPIIQFSRAVLVEGTFPTARAHVLLAAGVLASLAVGWWIHRRMAPRAAEYL